MSKADELRAEIDRIRAEMSRLNGELDAAKDALAAEITPFKVGDIIQKTDPRDTYHKGPFVIHRIALKYDNEVKAWGYPIRKDGTPGIQLYELCSLSGYEKVEP